MIVRMAELEIELEHGDAYAAVLSEEIETSAQEEPGVIFLFAAAIKRSRDRCG